MQTVPLVPPRLLERPRAEFTGHYKNHTYGYWVFIPQGLRGFNSPLPAPQHGFGVPFGEEPRSYLMVEGGRNSLESVDAQRAVDADIHYMRERHHIVSADVKKTTLGKLEARRAVVRYTCGTPATEFVKDTTIAMTKDKSIIFEVTMWTPQKKYREAQLVLDAVLRSWKQLERY